jgi:hypothetical protein
MSSGTGHTLDRLLHDLQERAKELDCLYRVDEQLARAEASVEDVLQGVADALPPGWQYPEVCKTRITVANRAHESAGFQSSPWTQSAPIPIHGEEAGLIEVFYTEPKPEAAEGPFLEEERRLLDAVAARLAHYLARHAAGGTKTAAPTLPVGAPPDWWVVLEFLQRTDAALLGRLGRKMINHLCWSGVEEAERLLRSVSAPADEAAESEDNRPRPRAALAPHADTTRAAFRIAREHLPAAQILAHMQAWIMEEKAAFLKNALERDTPLAELAEALQRFRHMGVDERELSGPTRSALLAALTRRFLTDQLDFVEAAKQYLEVADFHDLAQRMVYPARSHGRVGGKAAGLVLAEKVIARSREYSDALGEIRTPRSWYMPSDGILDFIHRNDLDEAYERKYLDPERVRLEYPHVVQLFKNSFFSPEIQRGLTAVLDDLEGRPVIVRSSSLLEDRLGAAFSGKYKSLFLANLGSKRERAAALTDAIAEVYASVFSPDPIEYRARRGFLDLHEEMGILIQQVVGRRVGPYYLPAFAGVGFSNNEFRWSPRIRREDGLLRLVMGLGTRAVDRLADDYPVLVAPGQPGLRINQTAEETLRYAPQWLDVINLETGRFETVGIRDFLARHGHEMPLLRQMLSIVDADRVRPAVGLLDLQRDEPIVTFAGLISDTPFVTRMRALLQLLREKLKTPVDIEFACDGEQVYLLQCRPQGVAHGAEPASIPRDLPRDRVVFTANRFVSNGQLDDIRHIVYVDPERYAGLEQGALREVGRAVGRLNRLLPKRQFALIGPGRWGSRGDIRLGVPVTYADISNAAVLIEIARQKGGYVPDLSFGTHFFQDLVESSIRYLPLYPDDPDVIFNQAFLTRSPNALRDLAPELAHLEGVLRVIDVPRVTDGLVLRVLMNAELDEAVGVLSTPDTAVPRAAAAPEIRVRDDDHWRWRLRMAQQLAAKIDAPRLGVKALWVIGSSKNATAGPASDIDLLVHVEDDAGKRRLLAEWLAGWSLCLAEVNYLRTGYRSDGLLDVHYLTDTDIARGTSYSAKIGAVTDAARPLPLGGG